MAVVAVKTTAITNLDASPSLRPQSWTAGGATKSYAGTIEATAGDSIASIYRFFRIGSWMRPVDLLLSCDALSVGAGDIGLYRTAADGGAVVDVDAFGSAVSLASALKDSNVLHEALDIAKVEMRVWEILGLTEDPHIHYDVAMTLTTAVTDAGTISLTGKMAY